MLNAKKSKKRKSVEFTLAARMMTRSTEVAVRKLWKKYAKNILSKLEIDLQTGIVSIDYDENVSREEIRELEMLISKGYIELNSKFSLQVHKTGKELAKGNIKVPEIDREVLTKNKELYSVFKSKRKEHLKYFKDFKKQVIEKSQKYVDQAIEELKKSNKTLEFDAKKFAEILQKIESVTEKHAAFLARNELGRFTGAINQAQDIYAGSKRYYWRTVEDNRVRPEHEHREGKIYYYSKPPAGGAPGEDYRCRCWAEAIFKGISA